jgi:hypothetical protein
MVSNPWFIGRRCLSASLWVDLRGHRLLADVVEGRAENHEDDGEVEDHEFPSEITRIPEVGFERYACGWLAACFGTPEARPDTIKPAAQCSRGCKCHLVARAASIGLAADHPGHASGFVGNVHKFPQIQGCVGRERDQSDRTRTRVYIY